MKKLVNWYKNLRPYQKLLWTYFWECFLWGLSDILLKWFSNEEELVVLKDMLFTGFFMGTILTLSTHWYLVKDVFSRNKKGQQNYESIE